MATRVYKYGLLPPTVGGEEVASQARRAHRYHNLLVEIERARRAAVVAVDAERPEIGEAVARVAALDAVIEQRLEDIQRAKQRARNNARDDTAELRRAVADLRKERKAAQAELRALKTELRPALQARRDEVQERCGLLIKAARRDCGCYWGTYELVDEAMDAARKEITPPRFRRWDGSGAVGVRWKDGAEDLEHPEGPQLGILDMEVQPIPGRCGKPRPRLTLRVASTEKREPVWATWPIILHRPLPPEAQVRRIKVLREQVGRRDIWTAHITIRLPEDWRSEPCGIGVVGVDVGWRLMGAEDALRVGYLYAPASESGAELLEDLRLSPRAIGGLRKADDIRSIRDRMMDRARPRLWKWSGLRQRLHEEGLPEWLEERGKGMHAWKSTERLARLVEAWREQRFLGDARIYRYMETWRKRDRHLRDYEDGARRGALALRREEYRLMGVRLARRFDTLVMEKLDLRELAKLAEPDQEQKMHAAARSQRFVAACSELRLALRQAFLVRGGQVIEVPCEYTTLACHACGHRQGEAWNAAAELFCTCERCGSHWDQDANAARNLVAWRGMDGAKVDGGRNEPLDGGAGPVEGEDSGELRGKWARRKATARAKAVGCA